MISVCAFIAALEYDANQSTMSMGHCQTPADGGTKGDGRNPEARTDGARHLEAVAAFRRTSRTSAAGSSGLDTPHSAGQPVPVAEVAAQASTLRAVRVTEAPSDVTPDLLR